jgi:hypothetical protein
MKRYELPFDAFGGVLIRGIAAGITGGVAAYAVLNTLVFGVQKNTVIGIVLQGGIAGGLGLVVVVLTLYMLGSVELHEAIKAVHRRMFIRPTIIPPQQSDDLAA